LDVACLGNVRYHGGHKGYSPLTMAIVHRCGYTELNSTDVILNYNDIIRVHTHVPRGDGPEGALPSGSRPIVQGGRDGGRQGGHPTPRGRYARPDRNGGDLNPSVICDACRRTEHVAANCDVLAIALFIEKYKKHLPDDTKDRIESDWLARWKSSLGNPNRKPRRVMKAYLDLMDMMVDDLDAQMCWECWPDEDFDADLTRVRFLSMRWRESYSYGICCIRLHTDGGFQYFGGNRGYVASGNGGTVVSRTLRYLCSCGRYHTGGFGCCGSVIGYACVAPATRTPT
jgi:hypothetical protein